MTQQAAVVPSPVSATVGATIGAPVDVSVGVGKASPAVDKSAPAVFETVGATADKIKAEWAKERMSRASSVVDKVLVGDAAAASEATASESTEQYAASSEATNPADTVSTDAVAEVQDGPSEGADATQEKSRLERIEEATRRAKNAARARRSRDAELARVRSENAQNTQRLAEAQRVASRVQTVEQALKDPAQAMSLMKQLGMTPEQLAQHVLQENTPEARIAAETKQREALQAELKAIKDSLAAKERSESFEKAKTDYIKRAGNAEKYPNLAGHPSEALLALGLDVANRLKAKYPPHLVTDHAILFNLNKMYAKAAPPKDEPAPAAKAATVTAPSKAAPKPSGTSKPKPEQPRTLTHSQAAGSFVKPSNWDQLPRSQRIALAKENVRRT